MRTERHEESNSESGKRKGEVGECLYSVPRHSDQEGLFDKLQIAERNRQHIRSIESNQHDGYALTFMDGFTVRCRTQPAVRKVIISHLTEDLKSLTEDA